MPVLATSVPLLLAAAGSAGVTGAGVGADLGRRLPLWTVLPFVGLLLSIAVFPLLARRVWERHYPAVAAGWGFLFALPFVAAYRATAAHALLHMALLDYLPFIILLTGLFSVTGGILVRGHPVGSPRVNTAFLAVGTLAASWIGTTGASMLLVRPVLRANAGRPHRTHVMVFFIFLVANIGGCLTPLGDPPLFLGFLHGVPFFWTLRLLPHLAVAAGFLLGAFYFIDRAYWRADLRAGFVPSAAPGSGGIEVVGRRNLVLLAGILGAVLLSGYWDAGSVSVAGVELSVAGLLRDAIIVVIAILSLLATPAGVHRENGFSWEPVREVAILFAGIFATIVPALAILRAGEQGALGFLIGAVEQPRHYFWAAGGLSSFLDNAPTYLTFFNSALGRSYPGLTDVTAAVRLASEHRVQLEAIAVGAVFMGANTYIGNAPNFMVKTLAEEAGVPMPSFFGYVLRWSLVWLVPLFVLMTFLFF